LLAGMEKTTPALPAMTFSTPRTFELLDVNLQ
jgi:hypothetical protein